MATTFTKGQEVKVRAVIPQGPVQAFRMDEDGVVYCLIVWTDADSKGNAPKHSTLLLRDQTLRTTVTAHCHLHPSKQ